MGTLKIKGRIRIAQFWPNGSADADTTQIELEVAKSSFTYASDDRTFKKTNVYNTSYVTGRGGRKDAIKLLKKTGTYKISVRLQGVDAPELHYKAPPLRNGNGVTAKLRADYNAANKDFCQPFAENSAYALGIYLQKKVGTHATHINAEFVSRGIDMPADALDTYGRFVGNIMIGKIDINLWLASEGWVVPTFYTSMSKDEIMKVLKAVDRSKSKGRVWSANTIYDCKGFEKKRAYRKPPCEYVMGGDKGKVLVPKLFRRTVNFNIEKISKYYKKSFSEYVNEKGQSDTFYDLNDFFEQGASASTQHKIFEFIDRTVFTKKIDKIIFGEGPSTLKSKKTNKKILKF